MLLSMNEDGGGSDAGRTSLQKKRMRTNTRCIILLSGEELKIMLIAQKSWVCW